MDYTAEAILISIHPEYVNLIFSDKKKIEFRKTSICRNTNKFLVYSTAPVSKIVGYFVSDFIEKSTPLDLWNNYSRVGGINEEDYFKYYENKKDAIGIHINKLYRFKNEIPLAEFNLTPPQSYRYINQDLFEDIVNFSHRIRNS